MKIAVCLSGQPRTFRTVSKNILERFQNSDVEVDYYIHCWTDNESYTEEAVKGTKYFLEESDKLFKELTDTFMPKKLIVESRYSVLGKEASQWESQMYSVQKSVQMALNSFEIYDCVFWTRMDLLLIDSERFLDGKAFSSKLDYNILQELLTGNNYNFIVRKEDENVEYYEYSEKLSDISLFTPFANQHCSHWCNYHIAATDWFLFGKPSVMLQSLYNLYDRFLWYKQQFPERETQITYADVSMELFFPLWCQINRVPLIPLYPDRLFSGYYPTALLYRQVCEIAGINIYTEEGIRFIIALQDYGNCFEQNRDNKFNLENVSKLWKDWQEYWRVGGVKYCEQWLSNIVNNYEYFNSSVRKRNASAILI